MAGLLAGCEAGLAPRGAWPGLAACGPGGLLVVQELDGQLVVGTGLLQAELAGEAGLVRAVRARLGAVSFPVAGQVQGGQDGPDLGVGERDGVQVVFRAGLAGWRRQVRRLVMEEPNGRSWVPS